MVPIPTPKKSTTPFPARWGRTNSARCYRQRPAVPTRPLNLKRSLPIQPPTSRPGTASASSDSADFFPMAR